MITTHEVYGRVSVDPEELATSHPFVKVQLFNGRDVLKTDKITVGKAALSDKGGYKSRKRDTTLVQDYLPLAYGAATRACRGGGGTRNDWEELVQVASLGLCEAADKYDTKRNNGFVAFAKPYVDGYLKNFLNPERNGMMNQSELEFGYSEELHGGGMGDDVEDHDRKLIILGAIETLTKKQKYAVERHYFEGWSQDSIAEDMNISQVGVLQLLKRATETMKKELNGAFK